MNIKNLLAGSLLIGGQFALSGCFVEPEVTPPTDSFEQKQATGLTHAKSFTANMQDDITAIIDVEDDVVNFYTHLEQDAENINNLALESHFKVIAQATILTAQYLEPAVVFNDIGTESYALDFSLLPQSASIESYNTGDLESIFSGGSDEYICTTFTGDSSGNVFDDSGYLVDESRVYRSSDGYINEIDDNYLDSQSQSYNSSTQSYSLDYADICSWENTNSNEYGFANSFTGDFSFNPNTNILSVTNAQTQITNTGYLNNSSTYAQEVDVISTVTFSYSIKLPSFDSNGQFSIALTDFSSSDEYSNSITVDNLYFNLDAGSGFSNYDLIVYEDTVEAETERLVNSVTSFAIGLDNIEANLNGLKVYGSGSLSVSGLEMNLDNYGEELKLNKIGEFELSISGGIENSYGEAIEASANFTTYFTYEGNNLAPTTVMSNLHLEAMFYENRPFSPTVSAIFDIALTLQFNDNIDDYDNVCVSEQYNPATGYYEYNDCANNEILDYIESLHIKADYQLIIDGNTYEFGTELALDVENETVDFSISQTKGGVKTQLILHGSTDTEISDDGLLEIGVIKSNTIVVGDIVLDVEEGTIFVNFTDGTTSTMFDADDMAQLIDL
ncbi:MAG: hypothetical protein HRU38_14290 [Saccharospirillaceae bacterium]|nr:hypothetical protein [Pseudomonadales bacterium]NRB79812.1 hypothetical protein [Saccharospirillaceae bacterium]